MLQRRFHNPFYSPSLVTAFKSVGIKPAELRVLLKFMLDHPPTTFATRELELEYTAASEHAERLLILITP